MASKITWHKDSHLDAQTMTAIERGDVDQHSHPELHQHLRDVCDACDDFLTGEMSLKDTDDYDLNSQEVDQMLRTILDEIEEDRLRMEQAAATPTLWEQWGAWLTTWRAAVWAIPAVACLAFLVIPKDARQAIVPTPPPSNCQVFKNCQEGGTGAFLHITVDRRSLAKQPGETHRQPFAQNATYHVGDAMLFRFQIVSDGFAVLLREDQQGNIEQIYPFPKHAPLRVSQGKSVELQYKGQPLAYYLEGKHEGKQTFRLLHVTKPTRFPAHMSKLTKEQKKLFDRSDFMTFKVRSAPQR